MGRARYRRARRGNLHPAVRLRARPAALRARHDPVFTDAAAPRAERDHRTVWRGDRKRPQSLSARALLHARSRPAMARATAGVALRRELGGVESGGVGWVERSKTH